jgi:DNA-binding response OmpR family regulator
MPGQRVDAMPTVLIAEDDAAIRALVTDILEDEGYTVASVINGRLALEYLGTHRPDLIITDVMMPELDGIALCAAVHAQTSLATIPIMLMSAAADVPAGAMTLSTTFLAKPFHVTTLLATVAAILRPPS